MDGPPGVLGGHIRRPKNSTLIAWHNYLDVAAIRTAKGEDVLTVNGKMYQHPLPTQVVVYAASMPLARCLKWLKREFKESYCE